MTGTELSTAVQRLLWTAWAESDEGLATAAADALLAKGMAVPEGGAAELDRLQLLLNAQPAELTEAQVDALAAAGNRAVNDAFHEDLCMCDAWPEKCLSSGNFFQGYWDTSAFDTAMPAVIALWEVMRNDRHAAKVAELKAERSDRHDDVAGALGYSGTEWDDLISIVAANTASVARAVGQDAELDRLRARVAELEAAPARVYRASHDSIVFGRYTTRKAAREHCEAQARAEGLTGTVAWIPDDSDADSPEELSLFTGPDDETVTGYVVTTLEVAAAYDPEADA